MILAGDIGGTKTILALYDVAGENCLSKQQYTSTHYAHFSDLLNDFLCDHATQAITACCLGVAGAIVDGVCSTTNLPWQLNQQAISKQLGIAHTTLLNDLEAAAWGVLNLPEQHYVSLNPQAEYKQGHSAILAAGTGLGEAIIVWDGEKYTVLPCEGGHTDFAPRNAQEIELLRYLMAKHPQHVSYERVVSGEGLVNIYQFLKETGYAVAQNSIEQQIAQGDKAAVIGSAGVAGTDSLCVEALSLFCRVYGAEASNLALKCLPYSGIYLAGGIAAKILPFLAQSDFLASYLAKGRFSELLSKIPVKVCTNPEVGLLGALSYATKQLNK